MASHKTKKKVKKKQSSNKRQTDGLIVNKRLKLCNEIILESSLRYMFLNESSSWF